MLTFPNAKINLGLNITEKRPDGYHNLETIFYPIPVEDALEINPLREGDGKYCLHQAGMEIAGEAENNLVVKAAGRIVRPAAGGYSSVQAYPIGGRIGWRLGRCCIYAENAE